MLPLQATPRDIQAMRQALGLDRSVVVQYGIYFSQLLRGNLGNSWTQGRPVAQVILERLPATLELATVGMLFSLWLGIPLGLYAASRPRSLFCRGAMGISILGISIPPFWLGIMLILVFSVMLGWLPSSGRGEVVAFLHIRIGFLTRDGLRHLILPGLTLAVFTSALIMRLQRAAMLEELGKEYVKFARAKGVPMRQVILRHAFRNTLITVITFAMLSFGQSIAFAVVTETIFAWPGTGKLLIDAIALNDRPVMIGYLMFVAVLFSLVNLLTDLTYAVVDPRVRVR
jgi:peptide/nickel transport system permease protein